MRPDWINGGRLYRLALVLQHIIIAHERLNIVGIRRSMISIRCKGYTFIELTVVIFLIGLTLALTVPRFRYAMLTDELKATVRRMVGTVRSLRNEAIREQSIYALHFDLESHRFWIESADMTDEGRKLAYERAFQLPQGVRIVDVWSREKGKKADGEAIVHFTKKGYIEHSVIHLAGDDDRNFTLEFSPFLGKIKVFEKYIEFE